MKPFLKYPGSKRTLAARVVEILGCDGPPDIYAEPFLGSGAAFFEARRSWGPSTYYDLSDACAPLIDVWRSIQRDPRGVADALGAMLSKDVTEDYYLQQRRLYNLCTGVDASHAARAIWLNRACFNGLWRFNQRGAFNVPWGKKATVGGLPSAADIWEVSVALNGAPIRAVGIEDLTAPGGWPFEDCRVCVYLDPPYTPSDKAAAKKAFVSYGAPGPAWTFADTIALVEWCEARVKAAPGVRVVLSYMDDPLLVSVLQTGGWTVEYPTMPRTISRDGDGRKSVREILATLG